MAVTIEDWKGDPSALGEVRRILKEPVENQEGPNAAEKDKGCSA